MAAKARYVVGIDLGTTNCAVSYIDLEAEDGPIEVFEIPQLVDMGSVEARPTLPSFLLLGGGEDIPDGAFKLPWDKKAKDVVGVLARDHGAKVPRSLVSSAKSWLCHGGVDRKSPILPADSPIDNRVSPIEASTRFVGHIAAAWNHHFAKSDPECALEKQTVLITVPASFDPIARELTVKAVKEAGLAKVTLLEEPQAAVYAWLSSLGEKWRDVLEVGDVILVCDVGGGTTDFSVISVHDEGGDLNLERIAVGDHILLGGDNMDLALAHLVSQRLSEEGKQLDAWQSRELWYACRDAKESLMADPSLQSHVVTVLGRSSKLIGGTVKTELQREDVEGIVCEGFFPPCMVSDAPAGRVTAGLQQLGLPYAADPAITKHLAAFLVKHKGASKESGAAFLKPTAVLFNGGVFAGHSLRERIADIMNIWLEDAGAPLVRILDQQSLDLAVARGATYYGKVLSGQGIRIRGGTAQTYYIGVESAVPAVPGMAPPLQALCIAPFGMEEGTEAYVESREFGLVVGEQAEFRFMSSSSRREDAVGSVIPVQGDEIVELAPLVTTLDSSTVSKGTAVPVKLKTRVTEFGTLEVWCEALGGKDEWRLEYNIRQEDSADDVESTPDEEVEEPASGENDES